MTNTDPKKLDQTIALAALAQSIKAVQQVAWRGTTNQNDLKAVVLAILKLDTPSYPAVYGGSFELSNGLRMLNQQLDPQIEEKDPEFVNLAIHLIALQGQLAKNQSMMSELASQIEKLVEQFKDIDFDNQEEEFDRLLEACSNTYKQTLSQMNQRIQVRGEPANLKNERNQNLIRSALLAAIRACFLWRQAGGSRWHFLFGKKHLLTAIKKLLAHPIRD